MKWKGTYLGYIAYVDAETETEAKNKVMEKVMEHVRNIFKQREITIEKLTEDESNNEE